ncbi:MAG: hypothetical protein ACPGVA_16960 [Pikeienuella sp.]
MSLPATRLFIVTDTRRPDDPLDVIASAAPLLARHYGRVVWVTPEIQPSDHAQVSLRGLRRSLRPGRDRVLFDLTQAATARWAAETARTTPGAILCGTERLPLLQIASPALRRARRRYGGLMRDYFAPARLAALEADLPEVGANLTRPVIEGAMSKAVNQPEFAFAAICAPGGTAETYGVLRGWRAARAKLPPDALRRILISVVSTADALEVQKYLAFLEENGEKHGVEVTIRAHRSDLWDIARRSAFLIDLDRFSWSGRTDVLAVADALQRPRLRLTSFLSEISGEMQRVLTNPPQVVPQPGARLDVFAASVTRFIESAQKVPIQPGARLGVVA